MGLMDKIKESLGFPAEDGVTTDDIDQKKEEQELAGWIRSKVEEIRSGASRIAHEGIWMQNMAAVLGFQNLQWNAAARSFQPINRASGYMRKNRIMVNKILPYLQIRLAKLTKNPPKYEIRPNDSTQEAKDNARLKSDILDAKWEDLQINVLRQELVMITEEYGHAYLALFWDETKGELMHDPITGEMDFEGDIRVDVLTPFEIFPDPLATSFDQAKYWISAKVKPISYFRDQFPEKGQEVKPEEVWLLSAQYQARVNTMNTRGPAASGQIDAFKNCALELTYIERPCRKYPRGRMIITANGILLKNEELPTGSVNLVKFDCMKIGGKYYSESFVTHARPIVDQYNQVIRRRADWTNRLLTGKMVYPKGAEIQREALTDEQGEMIQYTPVMNAPGGGEPKPLDIPMIPSYAYKEEESLDAMLAEIFGIGDVSRGTLPSASIPALGMQMLVEADDARITPQITNHEQSFATIGQLILDFVQQYYKTPRKMKFLGENQYTVKDIDGTMLNGKNDVIVTRGSMIPGSRALKRQDIANAVAMGFYGNIADPEVRQEVVAAMEYGDMAPLFIDASLENHRATAIIKEIKEGRLPDIDEADPFKAILKEMKRFRLSDEFNQYGLDVHEAFYSAREECIRILGEQTGMITPNLNPDEEQMALDSASQSIPPEAGGPLGDPASLPPLSSSEEVVPEAVDPSGGIN